VLIDWFTVLAQIVNFLVLVALLKHFLWGRLTRAIDEREARVAGDLARAQELSKEAALRAEQLRVQAEEQERKRNEWIAQARKEAEDERAKLIQESRESVRALERKWQEDLEREQATFFGELRGKAAMEILAVIRRALGDLASSNLQKSVIDAFLEKLQSLGVATLRELGAKEHVVRSAMDLSDETREKIRNVLQARLTFERDTSMSLGIELRGNGQKIGWNLDSYLGSMEENLKEVLERRAKAAEREVLESKDD
jgi:F-type H+-transporting ATPase subunit b